ncbi:CCA-adding enzyme [Frankliniella fusca]|uniref:CCA-adding enzyme n=1 Tax=Frankliniella fusca TaxID=407009 RepID=A0AAE1LND4_9NEOP|nr:CCA-adding enzyme [Frankliniella fusca]
MWVKEMGKATRSIGIQCTRSYLCYEKCKQLPEEEFRFYTGRTQEVFELLHELLGGDEVCANLKYDFKKKTPKRTQFQGDLSPKDKLFMTLLRLRRGITLNDLKIIFQISESRASKICYTWIRFMSLEFKKLEKLMFVSRENQDRRRPKCFKDFKNLRVIIDATEFRIQKPTNQQQSSNSFTDYKSYHTIKFLVGISCFGGLSFITEGFEGSISDRKLIEDSAFMDYLEPHDGVMSDKGFDMEDKCDEREVDLYIPSFLGRRSAFTGRELIYSRAIAVSRIFVEVFIGKIKEFRLVRFLITNSMLPVASDLVRVCAFLVNFQKPFIPIDEEETREL